MRIVTGDGSVIEATPDHNADVLDVARVGVGALGILSTVTVAVRPRLQPARGRAGRAGRRRARAVGGRDRRQRPLRVLLDPGHPLGPDQAQPPHRRAGPAPASLAGNPRRLPAHQPGLRRDLSHRAAPARPHPSGGQAGAQHRAGRLRRARATRCSPVPGSSASTRWSTPSGASTWSRRSTACGPWSGRLGVPISFPVEVRVVAADDIPLSTAHGRETAYIAVHVYQGTSYDQYFQGVEHIMDDYGGRPHWGKLHFQYGGHAGAPLPPLGRVPGHARPPRSRRPLHQPLPRPHPRPRRRLSHAGTGANPSG